MPRDPLDLIEQAESKGKNVPNYKFGPGFSAQGYYQITTPTWRDFAKKAGVDLSQYPSAMSAPREVQRAVAEQIFQKSGFKRWEATKHLAGQEANYRLGATPPTPPPRPAYAGATPAAAPSGSLSGAMQRAMSFEGMNERANADVLGKFMAQKGIPFTPQNIAWCATFVNSSLAEQGLPTTGSNMARSFMKWGQPTTTPNQGDIAVFSRGNPNAATGHVGFYGGTVDRDGQQFVRVFGGNQGGAAKGGGEAGWTEMPASRLLGYRTHGGGGTPSVPAATGLASNATPAFDPNAVPTLPGNPARGILGENPMGAIAGIVQDQQAQQQAAAQQMEATQAAASSAIAAATPPPPSPMAPPPTMTQQPPADYASLLLPRLRRGLLGSDNYGLLGV